MKLLTMKEAARILSLSERTLYQWHWQRKNFPFIKLGRSLRVSDQDLYYFIQKNKSKKVKKEVNNGCL